MSDYEKEPLIHIHSQDFWHGTAYLVGNTEGLCKLINALIEAIANKSASAQAELICNDGEGYTLKIVCSDNDGILSKLAVPYTGVDAKEDNPEIIHPSELHEYNRQKTDNLNN